MIEKTYTQSWGMCTLMFQLSPFHLGMMTNPVILQCIDEKPCTGLPSWIS